jgi:hypothetical protein
MTKVKQFFCACLLLVDVALTTPACGQQVDTLVSKFDRYRTSSLQEKLFVHVDQTFHLTGEKLWFKIYSVDGSFHRPLNISSVAYVELLDATNAPLLQAKIQLKQGEGGGSLFLPATLTSGNYQLRAYTEWMKNTGVEFFFHQSITVVNPFIKLEVVEKPKSPPPYDVQFFPEGGHWVSGLKSKVAFRATDHFGKGIDFKGAILNEQNDTLAKFRPLKFGIGHFDFIPALDEKYTAVITDLNGRHSSVKLPQVQPAGYVMRLSENERQLEIEITDSNLGNEPVYLFAHARLIKITTEAQQFRRGNAQFIVDKSNIPDGISHFTIFNKDLQPVCERLFFKAPQKKLSISVESQRTYGMREKIKLDLRTRPASHLSLSVYQLDSLTSIPGETILESLWLNADLKGTVESPAYYFSTGGPEQKEATDNLMLTHGWRRFSWLDVLTPAPTIKFKPELHGLVLKGKTVDASGAPRKGIVTYLASPSKTVQFHGAISDENGLLHYDMKNLYGSQKIMIQTDRHRDSTYRIEIETPFSGQFASRTLPPFLLPSSMEAKLLKRSVSMQVQNSYFEEEINKPIKRSTDSIAFYGTADETYNLDDYTRFPIMEEVMREYVPGVLLRKRKDNFYFLVLDKLNKSVFRENSMILLDGVPIFDVNKIMAFDPLKVKKLEVVNRIWYLGPLTLSGIVSYRTYEGDLGGFPLDPQILTFDYEGLQQQLEFYSPRYDQSKDTKRIPDQRSLLYWNPTVTPDGSGNVSLEFYSSDRSGVFQVMVQGIANDGSAGYSTSTFVVK